MLPRLLSDDTRIGFRWARPDGTPARLVDLLDLPGAEPERWLPTHLSALDDVLIDVAGRFGEVVGGGRGALPEERDDLAAAYVAIDRASVEYDEARRATGILVEVRAGQILGTGALLGICCRAALGLVGAAPFDGSLDRPAPGLVGGRAGLHEVSATEPWRGARWLVVTDDGRRLPATLSMLLFDSSGVDKEATLREHREALTRVAASVTAADVDPLVAAGAVDWLLFDWVLAHRESPDSGAVQIAADRVADAEMIVAAVVASVAVRRRFDPS